MIHQIETWLIEKANHIAVEYFVAIGAAVEEIIAPIPSPIIMTLAGSVAKAQEKAALYLILLAIIGAVAKTLASWVVYYISDKAEDVVIAKFGKFVGITHKEVEKIGNYFSGSHKDMWIMALARAIPIIPTAPVSIVSGIIKLNIKSYLIGTVIGTFVRNLLYLYLGYFGASSAENVLNGLDSLESIVQLGLVIIGGTVLAVLFYRRQKQTDMWGSIKTLFKKVSK